MKRFFIYTFLLFCSTLMTFAQGDVSFTSGAPLSVVAGDRFRVEFVLKNAKGSDFVAPEFTGLKVLSGPNISSGSQYSMVNGVQSSSTTETYTYFVEALPDATKASVSAAQVTADGKALKSKVLSISIVGSGAQPQQQQQQNQQQQTQQINRTHNGIESDDILLRLEISKRSCYKGEALSAQLKLYTRVGIAGIENPKYSAFSGFWAVEVEVPKNSQAARTTIGSKVYEAHVLRQWLLYPQRSGEITIEPSSLGVVAQVVTQSSGMSLFDQFFGGGASVNNVRKNLSTGAVKVDVKALPSSGAPIGMDVAVGDFTLSSTLADTVMTANSAASLKVTLSGSGDFPLMETPYFKLPAEFEQYDVKVNDKLKTSLSETSGKREWEFPFVARSAGNFVIPAVEFAYFNPKTSRYEVLRTPEYNLTVNKDSGFGSSSSAAVTMGVKKEDLEMLGSDIRYIKRGELRGTSGDMLLYSMSFFIVIVILIVLAVVAFIFIKEQARKRADVLGTKTRRASKVALRRLRGAKKLMESDQRSAFFEEMLSAMWGFVGDRYHIEVAELSKERILREFSRRGVTEDIGREYVLLIEECEMAQYAPVSSIDMRGVYNKALGLFDRV